MGPLMLGRGRPLSSSSFFQNIDMNLLLVFSLRLRNEKTKSKFMSMFWKKDEDESGRPRPNISGPITTHHPNNDIEHQGESYAHTSPVAPGVQRPDSALHPLRRDISSRSSKYSTANMSRF